MPQRANLLPEPLKIEFVQDSMYALDILTITITIQCSNKLLTSHNELLTAHNELLTSHNEFLFDIT